MKDKEARKTIDDLAKNMKFEIAGISGSIAGLRTVSDENWKYIEFLSNKIERLLEYLNLEYNHEPERNVIVKKIRKG